jgi:hypothetical protein
LGVSLVSINIDQRASVSVNRKVFSMSFLKKLFGKENAKEDLFVPTVTQSVPGLEPIIVQAVENLFPNKSDQKVILEGLQEKIKNANTLIVLALLSMTKADDLNLSREYVLGTLSKPVIGSNTNYFIMRDCDFKDMKGAEKWVKSITKPNS